MSSVETPAPTDPNSSAGNFGGRRMAGGQDGDVDSTSSTPGSPAQSSNPEQKLSNVVQVIRSAEESILAISKDFPQASKEIRMAREALRTVLKKVVSDPGGSEPPAPRTGM